MSCRIVCWISASVAASVDDVASSRIRIDDPRTSARASDTSCAWPADRFAPPLETIVLNDTVWSSATRDSAWLSSASAYSPNGSRLSRIVPEKSTGSCMTMLKRRRSSFRGTDAMLIPSIRIRPPLSSAARNRLDARLLLPLPVRPTTPIFSPGLIVKLTPFSTVGSSGAYRSTTSSNSIPPCRDGHPAGGRDKPADASS